MLAQGQAKRFMGALILVWWTLEFLTSNQPLEECGRLLGGMPTPGAVPDRSPHHAQAIAIPGRSYRPKTTAPLPLKRIKIKIMRGCFREVVIFLWVSLLAPPVPPVNNL